MRVLKARRVTLRISSLLKWFEPGHLLKQILVNALRTSRILAVSAIIKCAVCLANFATADCSGNSSPGAGLLSLTREEVDRCGIYYTATTVNIAQTSVVDFGLERIHLFALFYTTVNVAQAGRSLEVGVFSIFLFCGGAQVL